MSRIIVHIAAVPATTEQRCLRCCCVLITLQDPKIVGACTIAAKGWEPGGFVGVPEHDPQGGFALSHDARATDEVKCEVTE
jgi:hypothetical protein